MTVLGHIMVEIWNVLNAAAPYTLLGLLMAGLLKAFLPDDLVVRHLGGASGASVVKAAILGAPLPLCSCGVVPAAAGLRQQGAGKGATASFLVATPETGVDSIAVTYALLDPVMTILRPLSAIVTAIVVGLVINRLPDEADDMEQSLGEAELRNLHDHGHGHDNGHDHSHGHSRGEVGDPLVNLDSPSRCCAGCACSSDEPDTIPGKIRKGIDFATGELLADIGKWFLGGIVIAGIISALIPAGFIEQNLGTGIVPMLIMLVIGIPLYVCATASTPLVAALALKGLSPGAALVFLLAGPVTNAASLAVIGRIIGRKATILYVAVIGVVSLAIGLLVNNLYGWLGLDITTWVGGAMEEQVNLFSILCSVVLVGLTVRVMRR